MRSKQLKDFALGSLQISRDWNTPEVIIKLGRFYYVVTACSIPENDIEIKLRPID